MMFMIQNFASKPKMSCSTITEKAIVIGFSYLLNASVFIANRSIPLDNKPA